MKTSGGNDASQRFQNLSSFPLLLFLGFKKERKMKLYVGNLSYRVTSEDLFEYFSQVGTVESANVVHDKETGRSKGFGFVEMATKEEAFEAIAKFNGQEYDGRHIIVNEARPRAENRNNNNKNNNRRNNSRRRW